jgi:hypothetical protein
MRARSCLRSQLSLFAALTAADLLLTWRLLTVGLNSVYESNPLAAWCLVHFGWAGLVLFKLGTALTTGGSAVAISSRRPRAGCGVLAFGSAILSGVVLYSSVLLGIARELGDDVRASQSAEAVEQRVEENRAAVAEYKAFQGELAQELSAGRCRFADAVERLVATERARDADWLRFLRSLYTLDSDRDCVATQFMLFLFETAQGDSVLKSRTAEWFVEYRHHFHVPAVPPWEQAGLVAR